MLTTRTRPRHNSHARSASVARTVSSFSFSTSGGLPAGAEWVEWHAYFKKFHARVNKFGRTCSGFGLTKEEALSQARAICDELEG
jgi:hypothetical protein